MEILEASSANTHIIKHAGKLLALEEAHLPWEVNEELETLGVFNYSGKLNGAMTAHPRICPETGELLFFAYSLMTEPYLTYYRVSSEGELIQTEPIEIPRPVMMHDWNITRNHVIFMDLPIVSDMDLAITTGSPFGFKPEYGARLGVMPRKGTGVKTLDGSKLTLAMFFTLSMLTNKKIRSFCMFPGRKKRWWEASKIFTEEIALWQDPGDGLLILIMEQSKKSN